MPEILTPDDPLPPRPPPVPAQRFIVGGVVFVALTVSCLALDARMFARGFPNGPDPLLWLDWALVAAQTLLGVTLVPAVAFMLLVEFTVFLVMQRVKRRSPEWWELMQSRDQTAPLSAWHHFTNACWITCGTAMLWPAFRLLFWP